VGQSVASRASGCLMILLCSLALSAKYSAGWPGSLVHIGPPLWWRLRNTLLLATAATSLAWLIAVPVGVWLAANGRVPGRWTGRGRFSLPGVTPDLPMVVVVPFIAIRCGLLPPGGKASMVLVLAISALPALVIRSSAAVTEVLDSPFIRRAHANGIPRARLLFRHALPAAAHSLISLFGLSAAALLGSTVLVEDAMRRPGLGSLMVEAAAQRDVNVAAAIVTLSAACLLAGKCLSALLRFAADPAVRHD